MLGLYIVSTQPRAGKTLFLCSLGLLLQRRGHKVGYMKPVGVELKQVEAGNGDAGALIVQEFLGQDVKPEVLTPVMIPPAWSALTLTRSPDFAENALHSMKKSYQLIAQDNDLTLVSGTGAFPYTGAFAGLDSLAIIETLDLKVLVIERFARGIDYDALLFIKNTLGDRMLGAVLNDIPDAEMPVCNNVLVPHLECMGVGILGVMPHEPKLNRIRSIDLAYVLRGRIAAGSQNAVNIVEEFIIGTMQVDNFVNRMRSSQDCAVIVGGDRSDLQLAALHCSCSCLILTGNMGPNELVRGKADAVGVPVIVVKEDTYVVARHMSRILKGQKFHDLGQIQHGIELVSGSLDKLLSNSFFSSPQTH